MKKYFSICSVVILLTLIVTTFAGCNARSRHGVYNETVSVPLADEHTARVNFTNRGGVLNVNMYLYKAGKSSCRSHFVGEVPFDRRDSEYTLPLGLFTNGSDLTKKEERIYMETAPIQMKVRYDKRDKKYSIQFSQSRCPALNMVAPVLVRSLPEDATKVEPDKEKSFFGKMIDRIGDGIIFCRDKINSVFDFFFGNMSFTSHWWFLFYIAGLLIMAVGLKVFSPLVWLGVIMQYAYLQYMSPPFFMLWPSIVGWGWMLLCVLPVIIIISFNFAMCVAVVLQAFTSWANFLILLIPAFISIFSIFTLIDIAFSDHLELVVFFIIGACGETYTLIGTFTDVYGNVWNVYRKN